ncbi:MAG: isoprenylcysteine carboxylmethyltransferase family protein [Alphaproteobacteria bacterium]|nr:MAG: isoprenylcysteine carboxylmethyltransferase family protein [Alphaproteobacteria bacterium]
MHAPGGSRMLITRATGKDSSRRPCKTGGSMEKATDSPALVAHPQRWLDGGEQIVVLGLYVWLVARLWPENFAADNWYPLLLLLSEGLVVFLLLIRRRTERISSRPRDWIIAFAGTFLSLLVEGGHTPLAPILGAALMLCGIFVHVGAKLSLWRSFGVVAADRGVRTGGLYALVRHPMYAGYMLSHIGFLLIVPTLWNLVLYLMVWTLLLARIHAEEQVLATSPAYRHYMKRVRHRLLPGVV